LLEFGNLLILNKVGLASVQMGSFNHIFNDELSVQDNCILWGNRVVVPSQGRRQMVDELHDTHPGICKMKSLARSYLWWPNMDNNLENNVKNSPEAPLHPWEWPSRPWERIHIDYVGPFLGKIFLIMVDAYSKWLNVDQTIVATSRATLIEKLRSTFAIHGLPTTIVNDNGSNFCSEEFEEFLAKKRHSSQNDCSLSSSLQWTCRKGGPDV
jgi:hypothetical protein